MKLPFLLIFQFFFVISSWATKAMEDGKITALEGLELVVSLAAILGVKPDFAISDFMPQPKVDLEENKVDSDLNALDFSSKDPAFPITKE